MKSNKLILFRYKIKKIFPKKKEKKLYIIKSKIGAQPTGDGRR